MFYGAACYELAVPAGVDHPRFLPRNASSSFGEKLEDGCLLYKRTAVGWRVMIARAAVGFKTFRVHLGLAFDLALWFSRG